MLQMESHVLAATGALLLLLCSVQACYGEAHFSTLPKTLVVSASTTERQVLKAGEDTITVSWGMNQTIAQVIDPSYHEMKVKLCYAPESQVDRGWRKTVDNLKRDKTCQFTIVQTAHVTTAAAQNYTWIIGRDVPTAVYFVRAYAYDSMGDEVGYGQTTDAKKKTNLFEIESISGRHWSVNVAAVCFSTFSLLSVVGFYLVETRQRREEKRRGLQTGG